MSQSGDVMLLGRFLICRTKVTKIEGEEQEISPFLPVSTKKRGHVMSECWVLAKKEKSKATKDNAVVAVPIKIAESEICHKHRIVHLSIKVMFPLVVTLTNNLLISYEVQGPHNPCW